MDFSRLPRAAAVIPPGNGTAACLQEIPPPGRAEPGLKNLFTYVLLLQNPRVSCQAVSKFDANHFQGLVWFDNPPGMS